MSASGEAATAAPARFLPTEHLARLALDASRRNELAVSGALEAASILVGRPFEGGLRELPRRAPVPVDRLEVAPEGPPRPDGSDLLLRTQQSLSARVERLLANLADEAAARRETAFPVSEGGQFTAAVAEGLLRSLPIRPEDAPPVFQALLAELTAAARQGVVRGDFGRLREGPYGLYLETAGPLEPLPADRPRARSLGGTVKRR